MVMIFVGRHVMTPFAACEGSCFAGGIQMKENAWGQNEGERGRKWKGEEARWMKGGRSKGRLWRKKSLSSSSPLA